jgi:hypothetical protein
VVAVSKANLGAPKKTVAELKAEIADINERLRVNVPRGIRGDSTMAQCSKAYAAADALVRQLIKDRTAVMARIRAILRAEMIRKAEGGAK